MRKGYFVLAVVIFATSACTTQISQLLGSNAAQGSSTPAADAFATTDQPQPDAIDTVVTVEVTRIVRETVIVEVPVTVTPEPVAAEPTPEPEVNATPSVAAPVENAAGAATAFDFQVQYTVQAGEDLRMLAERFGVSQRQIADANPSAANGVQPGQILQLNLRGARGQVKDGADGLRVRNTPRSDVRSNIITRIDGNTPVLILARTSDNIWYLVITDVGVKGFVMTQFVDVVK
jgi:LysM repeat protein